MKCIFGLLVSYMVDASDTDKIEASRNELHNLLAKPQLEGIPVLVLGNKRDLPGALDEKEIIERMYVISTHIHMLMSMVFAITVAYIYIYICVCVCVCVLHIHCKSDRVF